MDAILMMLSPPHLFFVTRPGRAMAQMDGSTGSSNKTIIVVIIVIVIGVGAYLFLGGPSGAGSPSAPGPAGAPGSNANDATDTPGPAGGPISLAGKTMQVWSDASNVTASPITYKVCDLMNKKENQKYEGSNDNQAFPPNESACLSDDWEGWAKLGTINGYKLNSGSSDTACGLNNDSTYCDESDGSAWCNYGSGYGRPFKMTKGGAAAAGWCTVCAMSAMNLPEGVNAKVWEDFEGNWEWGGSCTGMHSATFQPLKGGSGKQTLTENDSCAVQLTLAPGYYCPPSSAPLPGL